MEADIRNEIEIASYSDDNAVLHSEFAVRVWPGKMRRRSEKYNRWKFRGPAHGKVDGLLLAMHGKKVVGQFGLIPVKLRCREKIYSAQWACDLMVDPGYRKCGIGGKLMDAAMKRANVISLGNNPSPEAKKLMLKMGFTSLESGRVMIFPLDPKQLVKWALPDKLGFAAPAVSPAAALFFRRKIKKYANLKSGFESCELRDVLLPISEAQKKIKCPQIIHDNEFLEWRAEGLESFVNKMSALASPRGEFALTAPFGKYLEVYDWHCNNEEGLAQMFSALLRSAISHKCEMIQLIANDAVQESGLKKLGFVASRSGELVIQFSNEKSIDSERKFHFALYDTDKNL